MSGRAFRTEIVVRSYELDSFGHANNATYLNYLEAARCDCMNQVGLSFNDFARWDAAPVAVEAHLRYRAPAFADDPLTVETRMAELRRASFRMGYEIHKPDGTHVLSAWMEFLFLNGMGRPVRVPELFATAFAPPR